MPPGQQSDPARYRSAWSALVQLVRDGHSWSGRERNRLLLNCGADTSFADVSFVTGLDHDGDGRGLAIIDWDHDGDLDLWYRDRTAPRLRLMLNRHAPAAGARDFVAVKLEGAACNRDAIGAVAEVIADGLPGRLVRSVRAGDLFLSQSSRWLHFGLGGAATIREIRVLWPGGAKESFQHIEPGNRHLLKQGSGTAVAVADPPRIVPLDQRQVALATASSDRARVILPASLPLPPLTWRDPAGRPHVIAGDKTPRLVLLWSASCHHCRRDLPGLAAQAVRLRDAGLELVALSVDTTPDTRAEASGLIASLGSPLVWGFAEPAALDRLDEFQRALFDLTVPLAVPLAILCDRQGNTAAIFRGGFEIDDALRDWAALDGTDDTSRHALAPPFAGRWFTKPVDPAFAAEFMARQFEARLPEDALFFLEAAHSRATGERQSALRAELVQKHHHFARHHKQARRPDLAAAHFESALALEPRAEVCLDYGTMLASYGQLREAEALLAQALALDPDLDPARKALALVRKLLAEGN